MKAYQNSSDEEDYSSDEGNVSDEEVRGMHALYIFTLSCSCCHAHLYTFVSGIGCSVGDRKGEKDV